MPDPSWRVGVEIELMAPRGRSRLDLAQALAGPDGTVERFFHPQSEPSKVPGTPVFDNLTPGFIARDALGVEVARCVDDLTLQHDLDRNAAPRPGWIRIVSDDGRLLRLVERTCDAVAPLDEVLNPIIALFGGQLAEGPGGMRRAADATGAPIAIAAPLPGERERPCELITPPIDADLSGRLEALLGPARALGFTVPREAAVHLHFESAPLRSAGAVRALVALWTTWGSTLRWLVGVNPWCRRLGPWPAGLHAVVQAPDFGDLAWEEARLRLEGAGLSKYCDLNLRNMVHEVPGKPTVEVRILPGARETRPIVEGALLFEALLRQAQRQEAAPSPPAQADRRSAERMLWALPLDAAVRETWLTWAALR